MTNLKRVPIESDEGSTARHSRLLASYLLNLRRGTAMVRKMIRDDIARFDDLGARGYAGELREILHCFETGGATPMTLRHHT
jgi:hypothetical protein